MLDLRFLLHLRVLLLLQFLLNTRTQPHLRVQRILLHLRPLPHLREKFTILLEHLRDIREMMEVKPISEDGVNRFDSV
ncbi:hypothetical protein KUF71_003333 [Frankliniella fusca]|uniref:Secreted protein n=1 Tax=Frankliniella fusca TaxID=407009 RepID=A0AAE1GTI7_9NEOP|nr:hypothetical protein KUF71_003333 [Frankliniella fusca]